MTWKSNYAVKPPVFQTSLLNVVKYHTSGGETQKGFTDLSKSVKFLLKEKIPFRTDCICTSVLY